MSEVFVNCEGLPCPQPVIQLKRLLEKSSPRSIVVVVDNDPALENVGRFLASQGYAHAHARDGKLWRIVAQRSESAETCEVMSDEALRAHAPARPDAEAARTLVMIIAPVFGSGDDELGARLMKNFIATLPEMGGSLWRVVLLNGGVTLAAEGSHVLEDLRRLEDSGVSVLVCGTCLEHFKLLDKKAVGQTTNMLDVVTSMQLADKIVRV